MLTDYLEIARRTPTEELARIATRRALKTVRNAFGSRSAGSAPTAVVSAWSDQDVRAALRGLPTAWCGIPRRDDVLPCLERLAGVRGRALDGADAAAAGQWVVFGKHLQVGRRVQWSLDPWSGREYPLVPSETLELLQEGMDPKYPWALGRLDQAIALARGYWTASEPKRRHLVRRLVLLIRDFVDANPPGIGIQWACPMEVALRAANLAQSLSMCADAHEVQAPDFARRALVSLVEHCEFIEGHLEDHWLVPNNHLVADFVGLLVVGALFPALPNSTRWTTCALRGLERQMALQVGPDGVSFEGSVPYHRLSLELFSLAWVTARDAGLQLEPAYGARLHRMFEVVRDYCSERGLAPQIGDNDSGRVFSLPDRESLSHGFLTAFGAALFQDPRLKVRSLEIPDEVVWLLGSKGVRTLEALPAAGAPRNLRSQSGNLNVLRGAGAVLAVSAGPVGQRGLGGHSHNDALSFELHLDGRPLIVDPGTFTYSRHPTLRNALRSTRAHNTLEIDGCEQFAFDPKRLFSLCAPAACEVEALEQDSRGSRLVAIHRRYGAASKPLTIERSFELVEAERALAVMDRIRGAGHHRVALRLQFPDDQARVRAASPDELDRAARATAGAFSKRVVELGPPEAVRAVVVFSAPLTVALERSSYSPGYGELRPARRVVAMAAGHTPLECGVVVLFGGTVHEDLLRYLAFSVSHDERGYRSGLSPAQGAEPAPSAHVGQPHRRATRAR